MIKAGNQTVFDLILMNGELVDIKRRVEHGYIPLGEKDASVAETFIKVLRFEEASLLHSNN